MAKLKQCKVNLVNESFVKLKKEIYKIQETFENVKFQEIRKVIFNTENITDYRTTVYFESSESKNEIYKKMNAIKSNPITFLK